MIRIYRYDVAVTSEHRIKIYVTSLLPRLIWKFENLDKIFDSMISQINKSAEKFLGRVIKLTLNI